MNIRVLVAAAFAAAAIAALPATASGAVFNVSDVAGITSAMNSAQANSETDTINIAAGFYDITDTTFPIMSVGDRIDIVGAGRGLTVFSGVAGPGGLINLWLPTQDSELRGFSLVASAASNFLAAVTINRGTVRNYDIGISGFDATGVLGVAMDSGTQLIDGTITATGVKTALEIFNASATVDRANLVGFGAGVGVSVGGSSANATLTHLKIKRFGTGLLQQNGTVSLTDSLVDAGATATAVGVYLRDQNLSSDSTIGFTGERLTIVGSGDSQAGFLAGPQPSADPGDVVNWILRDSAIYGSGSGFASMACLGSNSNGTLGVNASNVAFVAGSGCPADVGDELLLTGSPFVNFASGDLRPKWNSDLIDAGATVPSPTGKDLAQADREVDGDNSGMATVDLGAFEYQRGAPTVSITPSAPTLKVNESTTFTAEAADIDGDDLSYAWTIDGAASPVGIATLSGGFISAGQHTVAVTVTDETGLTDSAVAQVTVNTPPPVCPAQILPGPKVTTKPTKAFKRVGKSFAVARPTVKQPYLALKGPGGKHKLTLSSVSKSKKVTVLAGSQTITLKKGTVKLTFGGKWNKKKLKAGSYRVSIVPVSKDSCEVFTPSKVTFKLK